MEIGRENGYLLIELAQAEALLLQSILSYTRQAYAEAPEQLNPKIEAVWYQSDRLRTSRISPEDAALWQTELFENRNARRGLIEQWIKNLRELRDPLVLKISLDKIDEFLSTLNDWRLYRFAEYDISEALMEAPMDSIKNPDVRIVMLEIHFLGWLMEVILQELNR